LIVPLKKEIVGIVKYKTDFKSFTGYSKFAKDLIDIFALFLLLLSKRVATIHRKK
jgi:hypothetical protein